MKNQWKYFLAVLTAIGLGFGAMCVQTTNIALTWILITISMAIIVGILRAIYRSEHPETLKK